MSVRKRILGCALRSLSITSLSLLFQGFHGCTYHRHDLYVRDDLLGGQVLLTLRDGAQEVVEQEDELDPHLLESLDRVGRRRVASVTFLARRIQ